MSTRPLAVAALGALLVACVTEHDYEPHVSNGDADRGRVALAQFECGVCHVIPGVPGGIGRLGPPLDTMRRNVYVAGKFPNTPDVLIRWIQDPPALAPETAMPKVGVTEQQARDMAAYLYSLE